MTERAKTTQAIEISVSGTIGADPAVIWSILGDFGTEHRWASQLKHCQRSTDMVRIGTVRSCTLAKPLMGRSTVNEELIEFEPGEALSYRLRGNAGPFRSAEGRWAMSPGHGGGTVVEVSGRFEPRSALVGFFVWGSCSRCGKTSCAARA
jgi:hypothetical protein